MRPRSTRTIYAVAAAAVFTLGIGIGVASAASHATAPPPGAVSTAGAGQPGAPAGQPGATGPGCGDACISLFNELTGTGVTVNALLWKDTGRGGHVGTAVVMQPAGPNRPNANFTKTALGRVAQFCGINFLPSSYLCQNLGTSWVFEIDWSPFGNESGLCVGVAAVARSDQDVTLQNCGQGVRTLWIGDAAPGSGRDCRFRDNYCVWISANSRPANVPPLVLSLHSGTRNVPLWLRIEPLQYLAKSAAVHQQLFAFFRGNVA